MDNGGADDEGGRAHFIAYVTAQLHDVRAFCWTWGSLSVIAMAVDALLKAL